jgi:hypothetical protein
MPRRGRIVRLKVPSRRTACQSDVEDSFVATLVGRVHSFRRHTPSLHRGSIAGRARRDRRGEPRALPSRAERDPRDWLRGLVADCRLGAPATIAHGRRRRWRGRDREDALDVAFLAQLEPSDFRRGARRHLTDREARPPGKRSERSATGAVDSPAHPARPTTAAAASMEILGANSLVMAHQREEGTGGTGIVPCPLPRKQLPYRVLQYRVFVLQ